MVVEVILIVKIQIPRHQAYNLNIGKKYLKFSNAVYEIVLIICKANKVPILITPTQAFKSTCLEKLLLNTYKVMKVI